LTEFLEVLYADGINSLIHNLSLLVASYAYKDSK